jgi:nucleoid DNA-binding protein
MRKAHWGGLAVLLATLALTAQAQVTTDDRKVPEFKPDVARRAKEKRKTVDKIFNALGPAMRQQLSNGREVEIPGVGIFRIVRVNAYRDLVQGIPAVIPARSYVEFVPAAELNNAANAPGAVPARTVDGYQFRVNPNAASGLKTEGNRVPRTRTR